MKAQRRSRGSVLLFLLTSALDGVVGQRDNPAALPPGNARYPLYRRLDGPKAGVEGCGKSRLCLGYNSFIHANIMH